MHCIKDIFFKTSWRGTSSDFYTFDIKYVALRNPTKLFVSGQPYLLLNQKQSCLNFSKYKIPLLEIFC